MYPLSRVSFKRVATVYTTDVEPTSSVESGMLNIEYSVPYHCSVRSVFPENFWPITATLKPNTQSNHGQGTVRPQSQTTVKTTVQPQTTVRPWSNHGQSMVGPQSNNGQTTIWHCCFSVSSYSSCTVVPLFTTLYFKTTLIIRPLNLVPKGNFLC